MLPILTPDAKRVFAVAGGNSMQSWSVPEMSPSIDITLYGFYATCGTATKDCMQCFVSNMLKHTNRYFQLPRLSCVLVELFP
jgi:hypothetical protein